MSNANEWNKDLNFSNRTSKMSHRLLVGNNILGITDKYNIVGENGKVHEDDQFKGIDGYITINGVEYSFQEKIRRYDAKKYYDFTLEYFSNVKTGAKGEFFHLEATYYIHGYSNIAETAIDEIRIIDTQKMLDMVNKNLDFYKTKLRQNVKHSNANFFPISLRDLDKSGATIAVLKNDGNNSFSFQKFNS